jgi:hypothetical protein
MLPIDLKGSRVMLLSGTSTVEIQSDHQHWLREIERWEVQLGAWENEQALLVREVNRLQQIVQKHGAELSAHAAALNALKDEIVATERGLVARQGREPDKSLVEMHSKAEAKHAAQRDIHERLKSMQHTLVAQLAMHEHEPIREG